MTARDSVFVMIGNCIYIVVVVELIATGYENARCKM